MVPTLTIGQRVLVNRIGERFTHPSVGDIVVFHPPRGRDHEHLRLGCSARLLALRRGPPRTAPT